MQISTFELQCSLMFIQLQDPDSKWLQEQRTRQPIPTGANPDREKLNSNISEVSFFFFTLPFSQHCNKQQTLNGRSAQRTFLFFSYELQEFNVYFTDTEQSFWFIHLLCIAASQCHGASSSERLERFRTFFLNQISYLLLLFFFFSSNKNILRVSTSPLMSSTCRHLGYP